MKMMMMGENQASHRSMRQQFWVLTKPCSELCSNRLTCPLETGGGWVSTYTSHMMGGGGGINTVNKDIISPNWI
jgi:hypothetical protein